jgi:hypothetical protein
LNEKLLVEEITPNSWQSRPYESITSQGKSKLNKTKKLYWLAIRHPGFNFSGFTVVQLVWLEKKTQGF